jgi:nicotinate phosphoribosyltransferase
VGLVYKLVARTSDDGEFVPVAKRSSHKGNPGGRKTAFRIVNDGIASEEIVSTDPTYQPPAGARALLTTLMQNGQPVGSMSPHDTVEAAREHHRKALAEMPASAFSLRSGEPAIPTRVL